MDYVQEIWLEGFYVHPNISFVVQTHYDNPGHFSVLKLAASNVPDGSASVGQNIGWSLPTKLSKTLGKYLKNFLKTG